MSFRGNCFIDSAGYVGDGKIGAFLKAKDGSFDYTLFYAPNGLEREFLAIALAAMTSDRLIDIESDNVTASEPTIKWFLLTSDFLS